MKIELINTMQIFFIVMFLVSIIAYGIIYLKNSVKKFNYNLKKRIYTKSLDYSKLMAKKNYISYEKYDIWRYCVQF